jgi:flagellar P-ring protein precursor FlgI
MEQSQTHPIKSTTLKTLIQFTFSILLLAGCPWATASDENPLTLTQTGGSRLKDLTSVEGARDNQLTSYGLVVGLAGSGDGKITETIQTTANMLQRFGVNVPAETIKSGNVAAVMVTANIGPFSKPGSRIDVTVSSIGDAKTLQGGVLLQAPLLGANNIVYAVAQGAIAVGGFLEGKGGAGGSTVQKNHPTVATIPGGAIVEREIPTDVVHDDSINLLLREPDFISAARMAEVVNQMFPSSAIARDAGTVNIRIPAEYRSYYVNFLATVGGLEVAPDNVARIVINERTGTIVATANARISKAAISHGSIVISIASNLKVSQPGAFSNGQTAITPSTTTDVKEQQGGFKIVEDSPNIERVAAALNALGVSTRDMMSIFQAMKTAGTLQAELVLN